MATDQYGHWVDPGTAMNPMQQALTGGMGAGAIGSGLFNMFSQSPMHGAQNYLNQIPGQVSPFYQPYMNAGLQAMPQLQQQYGNLLNNPSSIMNMLGSGYQQSPGYQWQKDQALQGINNAQAAGGMAGTPQHQQLAGQMAGNLANQDYYNYFGNALGLYGTGLNGLNSMNQMGFDASSNMAQAIQDMLNSQANLGYYGQQSSNQNKSGGLGDIFGGIGSLAKAFLF